MLKFVRLRSNRSALAFVTSITLVAFYLLQIALSWPGLKNSGVRGETNYIDQILVINYAKCFSELGYEVYKVTGDLSNCFGYQYSVELLRFLNVFRIPVLYGQAFQMVLICAVLFVLGSVFYLIKELGRVQYLVSFLALSSPGIWLLIERGNFDEVVLILTFTAGILLSTNKQVVGYVLLALSALFKFYTFPALVYYTFRIKHKVKRRFALAALVPLGCYLIFLILQVKSFPSTWNVSFGLKSTGLYLEFVLEQITNKLISVSDVRLIIPGLIQIILITVLALKQEILPSLREGSSKQISRALLLYNLVLIVFLSCYFGGMNFDYRLVFLAVLVSIAPLVFFENRFRTLLSVTGLISLSCNTFLFGFEGVPALAIQFVGDLSLSIFVASQIIYVYKFRKHFFDVN